MHLAFHVLNLVFGLVQLVFRKVYLVFACTWPGVSSQYEGSTYFVGGVGVPDDEFSILRG